MSLTLIPFDIPGKLFRSPMPFADFDPHHNLFDQFLEANIETVVLLIEPGEDQLRAHRNLKDLYTQHGIKVIHFPIVDFDTPEDIQKLETCLQQVHQQALGGEKIVVHCFAGRGRTGMFLALLARRIMGIDGARAISYLRRFFPAVETAAQEDLVINYHPPK